ncbi:MAG: GntR family transcriptional regulator [Planctomycetota bacterium]
MGEEIETILDGVRLDRTSGTPLAHQVADRIGQMIEEGRIEPGQKLPPTGKLAERVQVSRQVAQDAMALLVERHRVTRKPRLGTVVLDRPEGRTCGLWAVVADWLPLRANFAWLVMQEFVQRGDARGLLHREYVSVRSEDRNPVMPQSLKEDLRRNRIDMLYLAAVHPSAVAREMPEGGADIELLEGADNKNKAVRRAMIWLEDAGCSSVGVGGHSMDREAKDEYRELAEGAGLDIPDHWFVDGLESSFGAGTELFHELYSQYQEGPDGVIILDDLVAHGFTDEADRLDRGPDPSRLVLQENRGSSLTLPAASPRIQLDWGVVVEKAFARFQGDDPARIEKEAGEEYRFVHPGDVDN